MIFYSEEKLNFNSGLKSDAFAKARFSERIDEKGLEAEFKDNEWTFEPYSFNGTYEKDDAVFLEGKGFAGETLKSVLEGNDTVKKVHCLSLMCRVIEEIISQKINFFCVTPGNTFISSDYKKIIFVPELFYKTASAVLSETEYSKNAGFYIQPNLGKVNTLRFTQAVFSYMAITGKLPFPKVDAKQREEDIRDKNYDVLEYSVYGLTPELAKTTDGFLKQNPLNQNELAETADTPFPLDDLYYECGLERDGSVKNGKLNEVKRSSVFTYEQFQKRAEKAKRKMEKKVSAKRFARIHSFALTAIAVAAAVIFLAGHSFYSTAMEKPSTKGLSSVQTVAFYYSSVNRIDSDGTQYSSTGSELRERDHILSNIYVSTKANAGMDMKHDTKDFAQWLCYNMETFRIFGLSQFTIDGEYYSLYSSSPKRKDKVPSLTEENGMKLQEGLKVNHKVHYYLVNAATSPDLEVSECTDDVELIFKEGRWLVCSIKADEKKIAVEKEMFMNDYKAALAATENNLDETASLLSQKYVFIPDSIELNDAAKEIEKQLPKY